MKKNLIFHVLLILLLLSIIVPPTQSNYQNTESHCMFQSSIQEYGDEDPDIVWMTPLIVNENVIIPRHILLNNQEYLITGYERLPDNQYKGVRLVLNPEGEIIQYHDFGTNLSFLKYSLISSNNILSIGGIDEDMWFINTTLNHTMVCQQKYGGKNTDSGKRILHLEDGGYLLLGYTRSFANGYPDIWVLRTDNQQNELWNTSFGVYYDDIPCEVIQINNGYLVFGTTIIGGSDLILANIDDSGNIQWQKNYDIHNYSYDYCRDADLLFNGDILVTLEVRDIIDQEVKEYPLLLCLNQNGDIISSFTYGGGDESFQKIMPLQDGGYLALGCTKTYGTINSDTLQRKEDIWVVKLDQTMTIEWMKSYGGMQEDRVLDCCIDDEGQIIASVASNSYAENISQYVLKIKSEPTLQQSYFIGFLKDNAQQGHVNIWTPAFLLEKNAQDITFHTSTDQLIIQSSSSAGKQYAHFAIGTYNVLDRN